MVKVKRGGQSEHICTAVMLSEEQVSLIMKVHKAAVQEQEGERRRIRSQGTIRRREEQRAIEGQASEEEQEKRRLAAEREYQVLNGSLRSAMCLNGGFAA